MYLLATFIGFFGVMKYILDRAVLRTNAVFYEGVHEEEGNA